MSTKTMGLRQSRACSAINMRWTRKTMGASDAYARMPHHSGSYRIVVYRDGLQSAFQHGRANPAPGGAPWDAIAYCRTRKALMRVCRACVGLDAPEPMDLPPFKREVHH